MHIFPIKSFRHLKIKSCLDIWPESRVGHIFSCFHSEKKDLNLSINHKCTFHTKTIMPLPLYVSSCWWGNGRVYLLSGANFDDLVWFQVLVFQRIAMTGRSYHSTFSITESTSVINGANDGNRIGPAWGSLEGWNAAVWAVLKAFLPTNIASALWGNFWCGASCFRGGSTGGHTTYRAGCSEPNLAHVTWRHLHSCLKIPCHLFSIVVFENLLSLES